MTMQEHLKQIQRLAAVAEQEAVESVIVPAANELLANIINRNINEGKNTDGTTRKDYSTRPMYASEQQFIQKATIKPRGKTGETVFKNGKPHKAQYLPQGYKQLRDIQGRRTDIKNYEYTGDLFQSYVLGREGQSIVIGLDKQSQVLKKQGLEKNGLFLQPTKVEREEYISQITQGIKENQLKVLFKVQ